MTTKIFAKGAFAFSLFGIVVSTARCDEPPPACAAGRQPFVAVYTPAPGADPSCADTKGETVAVSTYNSISSQNQKPNLYSSSVAVESEDFAGTVNTAAGENASDPDTTHTLYSLGFFSTGTPVNDFCSVPTLTTTIQNVPGYPADPDNGIMDDVPATSTSYVWNNLRFYVTAQYVGTQMTADIVKTVNNVACNYHVEALSPAWLCGVADPNDPTGATMIPDDRLCGHTPLPDVIDPNFGVPFVGSQINPDFPVKCDPDLLLCVLTKPVPALN